MNFSFVRSYKSLLLIVLAVQSTACHRMTGSLPVDSSKDKETPFYFELGAQGLPQGGKWKSVPLVTDLNHDGFPDIAAHVRLDKGAKVVLGDGAGHWRESSEGLSLGETSCGGGIASGDVNRDGHPDLVIADHCHGLYVRLGDGQGHWQAVAEGINSAAAEEEARKQTDINVFMGAEDLGLGDVNEDGFLDIVATGSDRGGFTVYLGDGTGRNWRQSPANASDGLPSVDDPERNEGQQGGWAQDMLMTDVNRDGHLDVVASYFAGPRVWLGDGTAHWRSASRGLPHPLIGGIYQRLALADVNGDQCLDLVVANDVNGAEIFLQKPDGSWQSLPDPFPELKGGAHAVAVGDMDGDAHPDLMVAGTLQQDPLATRGLFMLKGDGANHWARTEGAGLPDSGIREVYGITPADLNGDGRLDLVVTTDDVKERPDIIHTVPSASIPLGLQVWMHHMKPYANR